ncbi:MAG: 2-C-methyl-D-erythritol 4-phosphate cytidylyltransferase [Bacilli bacterium]
MVHCEESLTGQVDVLVMAAGTGSRMGAAERKQWLTLCGRPVFVYVLKRLQSFGVTSCILVVHPEDVKRSREQLSLHGVMNCVVTAGGSDRQASVLRGLSACTLPLAAVHDAARPFLSCADFMAVLDAGNRYGAATLGHPVRDTLKRIDEGGNVSDNVDRSDVWAVQTPQVFERKLLLAAHQDAVREGLSVTDDAALLERMGIPVRIVQGSKWNIKLTDPDDLEFMRQWEAIHCE